MRTYRSPALKVLRICKLMMRQEQAVDLYAHLLPLEGTEEHEVLMLIMRAEVPWAFLNRLPTSPILGVNRRSQERWELFQGRKYKS